MRLVGLFAIIIVSSLLGTFGANSAPKVTPASVSGQVWSFQTPLGIIYGIIPHEEVDYPSTRPAGTIIVNTSQRRLYYLLGGGRAIRYGIAVGMEGYGWSGVSTVAAKREWPDWTPTPDILRRFPNVPHHMIGGRDNPLGARALYLGDTLYRIQGRTSLGSLVAMYLQAAFACPTMTSSTCTIVLGLVRRSSCRNDVDEFTFLVQQKLEHRIGIDPWLLDIGDVRRVEHRD